MLKYDSTHKDYSNLQEYWQRASDVYDGELVIHKAGETYLPKLDEQTDPQYDSYRDRARFFNATRRTIDGLTGMVFRKDPVVVIDGVEDFAEDVTLNQQALEDYAQEVLRCTLKTGAGGTLVDYPKGVAGLTQAEADRLNLRPLFKYYSALNVRNWRYRTINNISTLVEVILEETYEDDDGEEKIQYRQLILQEGNEDGLLPGYIQVITKDTPSGSEEKVTTIIPEMNGKMMDFIPFVFHRTVTGIKYDQPPLTDLVDANINHYQLKADHMHGLKYVSLPTPVVTGASAPKDEEGNTQTVSLGPQKVMFIGAADAKVFYLEFTGEGLGAIKEELATIEEQMAQMGARTMQPMDTASPITATASIIGSQGETSMLARITNITSAEITTALRWAAMWIGKTNLDKYMMTMSTDFLPNGITAADLNALVDNWLKGAYSKETLFANLQKAEVVKPDANFQDEEDKIDNELPDGGAGSVDNFTDAGDGGDGGDAAGAV